MDVTDADDHWLGPERRAFVAALRNFAERERGGSSRHVTGPGEAEAHDQALYERLAQAGYLGVSVEERYGGGGGGLVDSCLLMEEVFYAKLPVFGLTSTLVVAETIARHGSEHLKDEVLTRICGGAVQSLGFSEPEAGSDLAALRCRAKATTDGYVINGQKTWTSNAQFADQILLMARTGDDADEHHGSKHHGNSMFSIPTDTPGIDVRPIDTMAGPVVNDVFFTDVQVSAARLVGTEGAGWAQLMAGLNVERLQMSSMFLGYARRAFDDLLGYVRERTQFGQPVGSFQALKHRIADMATELECCRLLVRDVSRRAEAQPDILMPREASMVKLKVTETAKHIALEGMQMMGGYGYATEYGMEGHVRSTLVGTIFGGTSEVQRDIIGKTFGL